MGIAYDVSLDLYVSGKYRDVILPMTVFRRLDAVLEGSKHAAIDMKASLDDSGLVEQDVALCQAAGQAFYNTSRFTRSDLQARANPPAVHRRLSGVPRWVLAQRGAHPRQHGVSQPDCAAVRADTLGTHALPDVNLSLARVLHADRSVKYSGPDNHGAGMIFEELVRRFNEWAGEHWTPRDAVRLMGKLVFLPIADQVFFTTALVAPAAC